MKNRQRLTTGDRVRKSYCVRAMTSELSWRQIIARIFRVKLDLFKSAHWRWISKSYAEYCYRNSATVRRLVQSPAMQSTIFCGCPSDLRGKGIRRECHPDPLDSVFDERSFGQPICLRRYAIRNETGNQKKKNCTE